MKTQNEKNQNVINNTFNVLSNIEHKISEVATISENMKNKKVISDNVMFSNNTQSEIDEISKLLSIKDDSFDKHFTKTTFKQELQNETYYPIKTQNQGYFESEQEQESEYQYYHEDDEVQDTIKCSNNNIYTDNQVLLRGEQNAKNNTRNQYSDSYLEEIDSTELRSLNTSIFTPYVNQSNCSPDARRLQNEALKCEDFSDRLEKFEKAGEFYNKKIAKCESYRQFNDIEFVLTTDRKVKKTTRKVVRTVGVKTTRVKISRAKVKSRAKKEAIRLNKPFEKLLALRLKQAGYK